MPEDVYVSLVAQLLRISPSITFSEAGLIALIGGLAASRAGDPLLACMAGVTALLVLLLIPVAARSQRRVAQGADAAEVRRIERRFIVHVWVISLGIGLMCAWALLTFHDPIVHLLLLLLALGATITNIRDHYRPVLPIGKTAAILGPVAIGTSLTGQFYYQVLGIGAIISGKLIVDICLELYQTSLALRLSLKERELLARQLELKNRTLERRETERNKAEAELKRVQAELLQVSRLSAMGTMASTLAHELNQPLTAVANYARASRRLLDTASPRSVEQAAKGMEGAEASALRAGEIVRRIRGLVYRGDAETRVERLAGLVEDASQLALVDARLLGIDYRLELPDEDIWVSADAVQVQQVLINLIRNAVDAVEGSADPAIIVGTACPDGRTVEITVTDNGAGISEDARADLFVPFNTTKAKGMGLGLSISRTIIEAHGGRIWASDAPGGGTIFRFTLRRAEPPAGGNVAAVCL